MASNFLMVRDCLLQLTIGFSFCKDGQSCILHKHEGTIIYSHNVPYRYTSFLHYVNSLLVSLLISHIFSSLEFIAIKVVIMITDITCYLKMFNYSSLPREAHTGSSAWHVKPVPIQQWCPLPLLHIVL